jgi:precorrin-6y C5,15-methyltransferase (decarboxylating) CbiE subunit
VEDGKWITIIGCGPGSPDYVTPAARKACAAAAAAVGSERALALFPEFEGERIVMDGNVAAAIQAVEKFAGKKKVAVLVTGDPGLFSLAAPFLRRFGRGACEVVPGISSVQAAFARLGLDWAEAVILSAHHEKPGAGRQALEGKDKIALLAGKRESFGWIADVCEGLDGGYAVFACEDMTLETERVRRVDAASLRAGDFSSRTVVLIIRSDLLT